MTRSDVASRELELVRVPAPARRLDVGVLDSEPRAHHVVVDVVDLAALQIRGTVHVDEHLDALRLDDIVIGRRLVVPAELVRHAGAAAAHHTDPQRPFGLAFLQSQVRDLLRRYLAQRDHSGLLRRCDPRGQPMQSSITEAARHPSADAGRQSTPPAGSRMSSSSAAFDPSPAMSSAASATWAAVSIRARSGAPGMPSQSGVSVAPAERTPTRMPWGRISSARTRENPRSPYLDTVYAALPGRVRVVTMDPILMIV